MGILIENYWDDCFKNLFGKNKQTIKAYFTIINSLRKDCHASIVSTEELENFRSTITQLEKIIADYE